MRKKLILFLTLILSIFLFTSCSNNNQETNNENKKTCKHFGNGFKTYCDEKNICLSYPVQYKFFTQIRNDYSGFDYYVIDSLIYMQLYYEFEMYDVDENEIEFGRIKISVARYGICANLSDCYKINWDYVTKFYGLYDPLDVYVFNEYYRFLAILYRSDFDDYVVVVRTR